MNRCWVPHATWGRRLREFLGSMFVLSCGCNGITSIEVERTSRAMIYDDDPIGELDLPEFREIDLLLGEFENEHGIRSKDIAGVSLERVVMRILEPADGDLSFADRIEIFIEAPGKKARRVAHQDTFPPGESEVQFEIDPIDLEPYIVSRSFTLRALIAGVHPPADTFIEGSATLDIGVTLAGVCHHM